MIEELKVVEINKEKEEKNDEAKSSEKDAILKEYEYTLGY